MFRFRRSRKLFFKYRLVFVATALVFYYLLNFADVIQSKSVHFSPVEHGDSRYAWHRVNIWMAFIMENSIVDYRCNNSTHSFLFQDKMNGAMA